MTPAKAVSFLAGLCALSACATAPLTLNDNQIVRGERVGDVEIGMGLEQLLALKGVPARTIPMPDTDATTYVYDGLTIAADDKVYWIIVQDARFQTAEGITKGAEQISTRAAFGVPDCVVTKGAQTIYDYGNIYFDVENASGLVNAVGVMDRTINCKK
ncbi:MAG: hypothetical protein AAFR51_16630 [Pseudomonadota bacterium]